MEMQGECGRQFVVNPTQRRISDETKQTIDKLLLERISLAGIVRVTGVSLCWLHRKRLHKPCKIVANLCI
jgi:hypothetical protein